MACKPLRRDDHLERTGFSRTTKHIISFERTPHADTSLYPIPDGADEEALVMLSDILPTGFESGSDLVLGMKVARGDTAGLFASTRSSLCVDVAALLQESGSRPADASSITWATAQTTGRRKSNLTQQAEIEDHYMPARARWEKSRMAMERKWSPGMFVTKTSSLSARNAGVWIDHRRAQIVGLSSGGPVTTEILSEVEKHPERGGDSPMKGPYEAQQVPADDRRQRALTGKLNVYYDAVIAALREYDQLLLIGPGEAKGELLARLLKKKQDARVSAVEKSDHMTDRQIVAKVQAYFAR